MNRSRHRRGWGRLALPLVLGGVALFGATARSSAKGHPSSGHVVEIRGMAFQPAVLELATGDTVVWINRDIVPHTATGEHEPGWTTGQLSHDQTGRFVARRPGEIPYFCELHPVMKGRLIVR